MFLPTTAPRAQEVGATAQENPNTPEASTDPAELPDAEDMIVVMGARLLGQVDAPQPPVLDLDESDIAAYGAGSIGELLESLGPQVNSGRGRGGGGGPVILVNGVRISNFRELRSYPPEALLRTEVFSEEVAQRYGYSPDQRVVNFILKENFSSREVEVEYQQPFDGGFSQQEVQATYVRIDGPSRLNLNLEWDNSSLLTEGERGVIQADGSVPDLASDPDPAFFRSLQSDSSAVEANLNWSTKLGDSGNSMSLNGSYERDNNLRLQGLDTVTLTDPDGNSVLRAFNADDPLTIDRKSDTYSLGASLDLALGDWQVTATADASRADSNSIIQRRADSDELDDLRAAAAAGDLALDASLDGLVADAGFDEANSTSDRVGALVTARGNPIYLPAGDVSVTLDAGYNWNRIQSVDTRNPGLETDLDRGNLSAGVNVGIPLTLRDEFLGAVGDITLNLSAGFDELSDFGTLYDWTAGITWGLTDTLTGTVNYVNRDAAPSLAQLGNPETETLNVPVFDLTNGETVLATVISGGNPNLPAQSQSDWNFGLIWQLPLFRDATFSFDYVRNHSEDITEGFPVLTPAIEAAFPDRVTRDNTGRLIAIDQRAVTFAEQDVERLQFGLNFSGDIPAPESSLQDAGGAGGPGGFPGGMPPGGPAPGGFGQGGGAGGPAPGMDPERMAEMRAQFCDADPAQLIALMNETLASAAAGEAPPTDENGEALAIPPEMLQRLAGDDGQIDPERFTMIRERICSADGPGAQAQGAQQQRGGPPRGPGGPGGGPGGGRGRGPGGPGMFGPPGGDGGGRWFFNINYRLDLDNTVLIAPGVPILDLLDGDALSGGGQARHGVNMRVGVFYNGFGLLSFWNYTGKSRINGSEQLGSTDLFFEDRLEVNLRSFADLNQRESLIEAVPLLQNTRIGIGIDNLFDSRQRVTDEDGEVPLRYQPFLIDPVGRSFEIEIRKLF